MSVKNRYATLQASANSKLPGGAASKSGAAAVGGVPVQFGAGMKGAEGNREVTIDFLIMAREKGWTGARGTGNTGQLASKGGK